MLQYRLRKAELCYGKGVDEVMDQRRKLVTFEKRAVAADRDFFCTAVTCSVNEKNSSNITPRYLNESTCSTGSPLMTIGLMTVLLRRKSMHISFVLETFRCRTLLLHQLEKLPTLIPHYGLTIYVEVLI